MIISFYSFKHYLTKSISFMHSSYHFMLLFLLGIMLFSSFVFPAKSLAGTKKVKWKSQPATLQIGKTFRYRVSGAAKKSTIRFYSNRPKKAKINSKTGKLHAKKQGSVIITAKINQKKRSAKLKTKLKIIAKSNKETQNQNLDNTTLSDSYLKNVQFTAADTINPWDHSLLLYSDRILLQKEVENTKLQLSSDSSDSEQKESFTASFVSLSSDGKTIRYQLSESDAEKMCPGNGTVNADYSIQSSFFPKTLSIKYQERIVTNSISGYVLSKQGAPLSGALLQLISESSDTVLDTTHSDQNGFYQFRNISASSIRLTARVQGYDDSDIKHLAPVGHALCQNLIMQPANSNELALSCKIFDFSEQSIQNATVILTDTESKKSIQGQTDQNGSITFAASKPSDPADYSYIKYQNQLASPLYQKENFPVAEQCIIDTDFSFHRNTTYQLQILPAVTSSAITGYSPLSFSFSFADTISDRILFHIILQELPILSVDSMSVNIDTLNAQPDYLNCSLYSPAGDLLFQALLPAQNHTNLSKELNRMLIESSLHLYDGNYIISFLALDDEQFPLSAVEFNSVSVHDGKLASLDATLFPSSYLKSFLYAKISKESLSAPVAFTLYQEYESTYFPIHSFYSDDFSMLNADSCKSFLRLSALKADTGYFLMPDSSSFSIASNLMIPENNSLQNIHEDAIRHGISFDTKKDAFFSLLSSSKDTMENTTPSFQIILNPNRTEGYMENVKQNINRGQNNPISWDIPLIPLNRTYFDSANSYPNTVYAYHQKDGSLLNISLQSTADFSFTDSSLIINCLKNGTDIVSNQISYRLTPFFVT